MAGKAAFARSKLPLWLGLVVVPVVGAIAWSIAVPRARGFEEAGVIVEGPYKFVAFFAVFAGAAVYIAARRLLDGPAVRSDEFALDFGGKPAPLLAELQERLARLGYRLRYASLDDAGAETGPASPGQPLVGTPLSITEASVRARQAGIVLRVAQPNPEHNGLGLIEVRDTAGTYDELGQYLLVALGELLPGLRFKRLASGMEAEEPAAIAAVLPERPFHLPRSS